MNLSREDLIILVASEQVANRPNNIVEAVRIALQIEEEVKKQREEQSRTAMTGIITNPAYKRSGGMPCPALPMLKP